jgi:CAAX prenyl protease-like protein
MKRLLDEYPVISYVAPFALFLVILGLKDVFPLGIQWTYPIQVVLVSALLLAVSRREMSWAPQRPLGAVLVGLLVFVVWIGPDLMWSAYRHHWLFENSLTGKAESSLPVELRTDTIFLIFRMFGTAIVVPIVEELFWRGWLMRYLINADFMKVPLGTYSAIAMWITAVLFATEHGPYWDVGLLAGLIYNWWMLRSRNLSDCMIAHGVTNAALGVYVVVRGHWEYWL